MTGHVFLILLTFSLTNAFRSSRGQELAKRGIRREQPKEQDDNVTVFAGEYYTIFHIEKVFILLGVVPCILLRADPHKVRRKYRLAPAA